MGRPPVSRLPQAGVELEPFWVMTVGDHNAFRLHPGARVVAAVQWFAQTGLAKPAPGRPLDQLRVHHERIEAWIPAQAGIPFDAKAASPAAGAGTLRVVAGWATSHV